MKSVILIDGPYLDYGLRTIRARVDYGRLAMALYRRYAPVSEAVFYDHASKRHFNRLKRVVEAGYRIWRAPSSAAGPAATVKGIDVQLAVDMVRLAEAADRVVLLSGDADFAASAKVVARRGVAVEIIAFLPHLSHRLRETAGTVVDLVAILTDVAAQQEIGAPKESDSELWALKGVSSEHRKDLSAVWTGVRLERSLRELCRKHNLPESGDDGLDSLNNRLAKAGIYPKLTQKKIVVWGEIRNNAVHGHFQNYTERDVREMATWLDRFLASHIP